MFNYFPTSREHSHVSLQESVGVICNIQQTHHITFLKPGIWGQGFWKRAGGPVRLDVLRTRSAAVKLCGQVSSFEGMESALRAVRPGSRALSWVPRDSERENQDWGSAEG